METKTQDLQDVDMSFLNKPWYSQAELNEAYHRAYDRKKKQLEKKLSSLQPSHPEYAQHVAKLKELERKTKEQFIKEYIVEIEMQIRIIQGQKLIAQYGIPLKDPNAESPIILLEEETLEIAFKMTEALYYELYLDLCVEEGIEDVMKQIDEVLTYAGLIFGMIPIIGWIIGLVIAAVQLVTKVTYTKSRKYPKSIQNIRQIITLWVHYAKISDENKKILLEGVEHYILMQQEEYDDFQHPDGYIPLNSQMIIVILYQMLPQFRQVLLKLARKGGKAQGLPVMDSYPQAAGKDTTNEIDFPQNPQKDTQQEYERKTSDSESDGKILDSMRGRDNADKAACEKYDYEYSKVNFDVKLEKAVELDLLPTHAHNTAVAQTLKSVVLQLCSLHYAKIYWHNFAPSKLINPVKALIPDFYDYKGNRYTLDDAKKQGLKDFLYETKIVWWQEDYLKLESNIPLDMKEKEINPHIKKFNAESSFNALKQQQKRYTQGFNPMVIHAVKLDLIDESVEKYYRIYMSLYEQLKNETKEWYEFIEFNETTKDLTKVQKIKVSKDILSHAYGDYHYNYNILYAVKSFKEKTLTFNTDGSETTQKYYDYVLDFKPLNNNDLEKRYEKLANENINNLSDSEILESYYAEELKKDKAAGQSIIFNNTNKLNIRNKEYLNEYEVKQKEFQINIGEYGSFNLKPKMFYSVILYFKVTIAQATDKGYLQDAITKLRVTLAKEGVLLHGGKESEDKNLDKLQNAELI